MPVGANLSVYPFPFFKQSNFRYKVNWNLMISLHWDRLPASFLLSYNHSIGICFRMRGSARISYEVLVASLNKSPQ